MRQIENWGKGDRVREETERERRVMVDQEKELK